MAALQLFEEFKNQGYERIQSIVSNQEAEDNFVEYKTKRESLDDVRTGFAKAASAFANSEGGVIVWGIDKPNSGPATLKPISELNTFRHYLLSQANRITMPTVPNVQSISIPAEAVDTGFVVSYVPRSSVGPHQSMIGNKYYYRSGDNSLPMEHRMIQALMLSTAKPQLDLLVGKPVRRPLADRGWTIPLRVRNVSNVRVEKLAVAVNANVSPIQYANQSSLTNQYYISYLDNRETRVAEFLNMYVLYPQMTMPFIQLSFTAPFEFTMPIDFNVHIYGREYWGHFRFEIAAAEFNDGNTEDGALYLTVHKFDQMAIIGENSSSE